MPSRPRPEFRGGELFYYCPTLGKEIQVSLSKDDTNLHAETESCSHCGWHESVSLNVGECECGRSHLIWIMSRRSG
jgi:hypothetical protein